MLFICYAKCSTCTKAKKHLQTLGLKFSEREIKNGVTVDELKQWIAMSNLPINKFFNTSGLIYRDLNYKEKLKTMSDEEKLLALSSNGMLIKRPLLISNKQVLVGYNHAQYEELSHGKEQ